MEELLHQDVFEPSSSKISDSVDDMDDSHEDAPSNLCLTVCTQEELLDRFASELSYLKYLSSACEGTKLCDIYKPVSFQVLIQRCH